MLELSRRMERDRREVENIALRFARYRLLITLIEEAWIKSSVKLGHSWIVDELALSRRSLLRGAYLRPMEEEVLLRLFDSEKPLTKWRLSHPTGETRERIKGEAEMRTRRLWPTQVQRAVLGLLSKKAIERVPGSERKWKSGKTVVIYRPTPLGVFFYFRSRLELHYFSAFSHRHELVLDCLQDVGVYTKSKVLKDLVLGVRNIPNDMARAQHLLALSDTVLEKCQDLGNPYYEPQIGCMFAIRTWSSWKDVCAYRGCVPAEYKKLLSMTRHELLIWERRIGAVLKSPTKKSCLRTHRFKSIAQDPWRWRRLVQEEVTREEMIKSKWIHSMQSTLARQ
jgi:hypothetical protein